MRGCGRGWRQGWRAVAGADSQAKRLLVGGEHHGLRSVWEDSYEDERPLPRKLPILICPCGHADVKLAATTPCFTGCNGCIPRPFPTTPNAPKRTWGRHEAGVPSLAPAASVEAAPTEGWCQDQMDTLWRSISGIASVSVWRDRLTSLQLACVGHAPCSINTQIGMGNLRRAPCLANPLALHVAD